VRRIAGLPTQDFWRNSKGDFKIDAKQYSSILAPDNDSSPLVPTSKISSGYFGTSRPAG